MNIYADIIKRDDEQRLVYGYASTEALDSQGEIVTKAAVEQALPDYMLWRNIREMHEPSAVGTTQEATIDEKGLYLCAKIVDDDAWKKVQEEVYKGFSIGGKKIEKIDGVVTKCRINEISLVDRPANPECRIDIFKIDKEANMEIESKEQAQEILTKWAGQEVQDVANAVYALQSIVYLYTSEMQETHPEAAAQATALQTAIKAIKDFIASEIMESDPGDVINLAEKLGDLHKIGATHSKDTLTKIQAIHDHSVAVGAKCDIGKVELSNDMKKLEADYAESLSKLESERADVLAKLETITGERDIALSEKDTLQKRVDELEAQPEDGKGALKVVSISKVEDGGGKDDKMEKVEEALEKGNSDEAAKELIKMIHSKRSR